MATLATLEQARQQVSVLDDEHDTYLTILLETASDAVRTYLQVPQNEAVPATAETAARHATLLLVGEWFSQRRAEDDSDNVQGGYGYLPRPVVALLYPHRVPAWA